MKIEFDASWLTVPVTPGDKVKVLVLMLPVFIGWLKVAVTTAFGQAVAEPATGVITVTDGGGLHPFAAVVKVQE